MTTRYQQVLNRIIEDSSKINELKQEVTNLRLPYAYFKKYNILPLNFMEGELDKYFEYDRLVFENIYGSKGSLQLDREKLNMYEDIHNILQDEFWKKFYKIHNLNIEIYAELNNRADKIIELKQVFPNLDYYFNKGAIDENSYHKIITNPINNIKSTIKMYKVYIESSTKKLVDMDNEVYDKIPMDKLPIGSVVFVGCSSINEGLIVEKFCPKTIKFRKHDDPEKKVQVNKDRFEFKIGRFEYQVYSMRDRQYANGVYQYKNGEVVFSTERKCRYVDKWVEE
tara:strand:- start:2239 stop:3084 length:846 start_codon:yes stop_codon:yes gene_type:complete